MCFVHSLHVGADESHEGVIGILHDERLEHERHIVEHILNLFGVDVLSGRAEEHGLAAAFDKQVSTFVQYAEVAGTKPSVLSEDVARSFFVLEISCHDVLATHFNLAYSGAVGGGDTSFHKRQDASARARNELIMRRKADKRGALGHTIANGEGEFDFAEERLDFGVERSSADDNLVEVASEGLNQSVADGCVDGGGESGDSKHPALQRVGEQRLDHLLVDLLDDEGHGEDSRGFDFLEGLQQNLGSKRASVVTGITTGAEIAEEVEGATVGVCQRKEAEESAVVADNLGLEAE